MGTNDEAASPAGWRDSADPIESAQLASRLESFSLVERGGRAGAKWPWQFYREHRKAIAASCAVLAWLPMLIFVVLGDRTDVAFDTFARDFAVHTRALLAVPILIVVEPIVDHRTRSAARRLVESRYVVGGEQHRYERLLADVQRLRDLPIVAATVVGLAIAGSVFSATHSLGRPDLTWSTTLHADGTRGLTPAGWWLVAVSIPLFEMLALMWLWRWVLWTVFVWRVARLRLRLVATHPDRSAGLAFLAAASSSFAFVVFGFGAILSASWVARVTNEHVPLQRFVTLMIAYAGLVVVFVFVPLLGFSRRLREVHHEAAARYAILVQRYIARFDRMWTGPAAPRDDEALGRLDAQNMADIGNVFENVVRMRFVPIEPMVLQDLAVGVVVPLLPILLAASSPTEILKRIVTGLL